MLEATNNAFGAITYLSSSHFAFWHLMMSRSNAKKRRTWKTETRNDRDCSSSSTTTPPTVDADDGVRTFTVDSHSSLRQRNEAGPIAGTPGLSAHGSAHDKNNNNQAEHEFSKDEVYSPHEKPVDYPNSSVQGPPLQPWWQSLRHHTSENTLLRFPRPVPMMALLPQAQMPDPAPAALLPYDHQAFPGQEGNSEPMHTFSYCAAATSTTPIAHSARLVMTGSLDEATIRSSLGSSSGRCSTGRGGRCDYNERERFFLFIKVVLKFLGETDQPTGDGDRRRRLERTKALIRDCTLRNRRGDPDYHPLVGAIERRLRPVLGDRCWTRAETFVERSLQRRAAAEQIEASATISAAV
jgi:hypothetical protein